MVWAGMKGSTIRVNMELVSLHPIGLLTTHDKVRIVLEPIV